MATFSFTNIPGWLEEQRINNFIRMLYRIPNGYNKYPENTQYKTFLSNLEKYNLKAMNTEYIHPSHYETILNVFDSAYSIFPKLQERKLDAFGLRKHKNKVYGETHNAVCTGPNNKIISTLVRAISLSVDVYNSPIENAIKIMDERANKEKPTAKQLSARCLCHEIGHALIEQIVNDKYDIKKENMNTNPITRRIYIEFLNEKKYELTKELYEKACQKLFINYRPLNNHIHGTYENLNTLRLLTPYSSINAEECFSEVFADFLTNPCPSILSVTMMKTFREMYPEYVNQDLFDKRLKELENAWNNLSPELKTNRISILSELRQEAEEKKSVELIYEMDAGTEERVELLKSHVAENTFFNDFKRHGRLDGPFGIETNDFVTYIRANDLLKQAKYDGFIEKIPEIIVNKHEFDESSDKSKYIFILAIKDILNERGFSVSEIDSTLESFQNIEMSEELNAARNLIKNLSKYEKNYLSYIFSVNPLTEDIIWSDVPKQLKSYKKEFSDDNILLLSETISKVVNYKHEPGEYEAIEKAMDILHERMNINQSNEIE